MCLICLKLDEQFGNETYDLQAIIDEILAELENIEPCEKITGETNGNN